MNKNYLQFILLIALFHFITTNYICEEDKKKNNAVADYTVSIKTVSDTNTPCGGYDWKIKFNTKDSSKAGGWLIQEINFIKIITTCTKPPRIDTMRRHYWEAWEIKAGKNYPNTRDIYHLNYDDNYAGPASPATYGSRVIKGKVKFFEGVTLPATMVKNNPNTIAGILHSDTTAPPFFNTTNATDHNVDVKWNCCDTPYTNSYNREPLMGLEPDVFIHKKDTEDSLSQLIESIPSWTTGYDKEKESEFISIAKQISKNSPEKIRNSIEIVYNNNNNQKDAIDKLSKIYILLRAIFNVPGSIDRSQAKVFGGWVHPSTFDNSKDFNLMWPLSLENNRIKVSGEYTGYLGSTYDALGEFDYFKEKFQMREIQ